MPRMYGSVCAFSYRLDIIKPYGATFPRISMQQNDFQSISAGIKLLMELRATFKCSIHKKNFPVKNCFLKDLYSVFLYRLAK